jgi:pimeloyl-ACP methyl ester carboxylesterase
MTIMFVHGVPDTPFMWTPLIEALDLDDTDYVAPALPGFSTPTPRGFACTKEAYALWLVAELEALKARTGKPVDLVGHDWGALLSVRVAATRPDLLRSWAVANALPEPSYRWHQAARMWQTPVLGEFGMWVSQFRDFSRALAALGVPPAIAQHEAQFWTPTMRRAILKLYRSATHAGEEWGRDLSRLHPHGLVLWGADDPFVPRAIADTFCARWDLPLHIEHNIGHWGIIQRPAPFAEKLRAHWAAA